MGCDLSGMIRCRSIITFIWIWYYYNYVERDVATLGECNPTRDVNEIILITTTKPKEILLFNSIDTNTVH